MRFHQLRNATCVIESGDQVLLVNLMLGKKGSLQPFARFRHKPQPNPLVPLPEVADQLLDRVTACLLTLSQKMPDKKKCSFRKMATLCTCKDKSTMASGATMLYAADPAGCSPGG